MIESMRITGGAYWASLGALLGGLFSWETVAGSRRRLRGRFERIAGSGALILQTAIAASAAWYLASLVLGHEKPFVAAIAAVITLGATSGREGRRAFEWVLAIGVGLAVADLVVLVTGFGTLQIAAVVAAAMVAARFLGRGEMLATEAGVSAVLLVGLDPSTTGPTPDRFVDALVGCVAALGVHALFQADPRRAVERAAQPLFDDLVAALEETAAALESGDPEWAETALDTTRKIDEEVAALRETLEAGYEDAQLSPGARKKLQVLRLYAAATDQMDVAVRNTRVLAGAALNAVRKGGPAPGPLPEAVRGLARAVEALAVQLEEPGRQAGVGEFALEAAEGTTAVLKERNDLPTSVLVEQVRSTSVDLMRASGMDGDAARGALDEATRDDK